MRFYKVERENTYSDMLQLDALVAYFYCKGLKASDHRGSEGGQRLQPRSMPGHA